MQNNDNFRNDLIVGYLFYLTDYDYGEEFAKLFSSVEDYLNEVVISSTDKELLEQVKSIIAYREKNMRIAM